jgi:hypothetical protein
MLISGLNTGPELIRLRRVVTDAVTNGSTNGPVGDIRLRRVVMDAATNNTAATAHPNAATLTESPAETISLNF